jgi:PKHD-type hydroxylase
MINDNNLWIFKSALSVKDCNKIIKLGNSKKKKKAVIGKTGEKVILNKKERISDVSFLTDKWLYGIIDNFVITANKNANWNAEISWHEEIQFTTYTKNGHYDWHMDQFTKPYSEDSHENYRGKIRKLSCVINLSNPKDYEGGDFFIENQNGTIKRDILRITDFKEQGSVIVFPSYLFHKVSPIKKGKRYSLVNWTIGNPWR